MSHTLQSQNPEAAPPRRFRPVSRLLHLYWRFSRGMTLGVRAVVLNGEGEVFLVRHTYTPGWHFPGGGVEPGETLIDALIKELREEANISLTGEPRLHGLCFNRQMSRRDHVAVYVVRHFSQSAPKLPDAEIAEAGFFACGSLPEGVTRGTLARLREILGGTPAHADW